VSAEDQREIEEAAAKRDFWALEKRRFDAVKLFNKDLNNSEIGRRLKQSDREPMAEATPGGWRGRPEAGRQSGAPALFE
jgi:hypothetical protein